MMLRRRVPDPAADRAANEGAPVEAGAGATPRMKAVQVGRVGVTQLLLSAGVDPDWLCETQGTHASSRRAARSQRSSRSTRS